MASASLSLANYPEVKHYFCCACPDVFQDFVKYKCHMLLFHPPHMDCPKCHAKCHLRDFEVIYKMITTHTKRPIFVHCHVCRIPFGNFKVASLLYGPEMSFFPDFYQFYIDAEKNTGPFAKKSWQYAQFVADRFTAAVDNLVKACGGKPPPHNLVERKYWGLLKDTKIVWARLFL